MVNKNEIKLMPEYQCSPLWVKGADGSFENISVDAFGLKQNIKEKILDWDSKFQSTLNLQDPLNSGFKCQEEKEEFEKQGIQIWKELVDVLKSTHKVLYRNFIEKNG